MKAPILLVGTARSGLGLIAEVLHMSGAFGGILAGVQIKQGYGMYENIQIRKTINEKGLTYLGIDRKGQFPLKVVNGFNPVKLKDVFDNAETIIKSQGLPNDKEWFYSDFRTTLLWQQWHLSYPQAKWVYVSRPDKDIIASCLKTGWMKAFMQPSIRHEISVQTEQQGWKWWIDLYKQHISQLRETCPNVFEVDAVQLQKGDYSKVEKLIAWVGLDWHPIVEDLLTFKVKTDGKSYDRRS